MERNEGWELEPISSWAECTWERPKKKKQRHQNVEKVKLSMKEINAKHEKPLTQKQYLTEVSDTRCVAQPLENLILQDKKEEGKEWDIFIEAGNHINEQPKTKSKKKKKRAQKKKVEMLGEKQIDAKVKESSYELLALENQNSKKKTEQNKTLDIWPTSTKLPFGIGSMESDLMENENMLTDSLEKTSLDENVLVVEAQELRKTTQRQKMKNKNKNRKKQKISLESGPHSDAAEVTRRSLLLECDQLMNRLDAILQNETSSNITELHIGDSETDVAPCQLKKKNDTGLKEVNTTIQSMEVKKKQPRQTNDVELKEKNKTTKPMELEKKQSKQKAKNKKGRKKKIPTGEDRWFGLFHCKVCKQSWESAHVYTRAGTKETLYKQRCKTCFTWYKPWKLDPIRCSVCGNQQCQCKCEDCGGLTRKRYKWNHQSGKKEVDGKYRYCDCKGKNVHHGEDNGKPHPSNLCQRCLAGELCTGVFQIQLASKNEQQPTACQNPEETASENQKVDLQRSPLWVSWGTTLPAVSLPSPLENSNNPKFVMDDTSG